MVEDAEPEDIPFVIQPEALEGVLLYNEVVQVVISWNLVVFFTSARNKYDSFRKQFGTFLKSYPKITFDKEIAFKKQDAEFLSFGYPLFEAVMDWVEKELSTSLQQGAVFVDPEGKLDGVLLFYEGEIKDGKGNVAEKRLFVL